MNAHQICATALLLSAGAALAQTVDPGAALAKQKNCLACHDVAIKIVGPAYKDIAKKYATQKDAAAMLSTKVIKGGTGVWGAVPMPPQTVSVAEAQQIIAWVLKQK